MTPGDVPQAPPTVRPPEQQAAVRRRALPVAIVATLLGAGVAVLWFGTIDTRTPPSAFAAAISYCVILMGVAVLFYAKDTAGTAAARVLCVTAALLGVAGTVVQARQTVQWRQLMERAERQHAVDIAKAAEKFAREHDGAYPRDLAALLAGKYVTQDMLLSPFGGMGTQYQMEMKRDGKSSIKMELASDYTYVGGDLKLPLAPELAAAMVVVYETDPVMRNRFAAAFADGTSRQLTLDDAGFVLKACNDARAKIGLPPLHKPASVERATAVENGH